jgi:hypothetical protein
VRCSIQGMAFAGSIRGPGKLALVQDQKPVGDGTFGAMEPSKKNAVSISKAVGNHGAVGQFEIERRVNQRLWHVEELFGERREFGHRQTAMAVVHRFGQRI